MTNEAAPLIYEYSVKKCLSGLGYRFDSEKLSDFEVEAFTFIASEFNRIEEQEMKRKTRRK